MIALRTLNVEESFPSLEEARFMVVDAIRRAKRDKVRILKIIHGYGSTGKGGTLNTGLRKSFALRKKEGVIKDYVIGERFNIFDNTTLALLDVAPDLAGDSDLGSTNEGVSFLWIQ